MRRSLRDGHEHAGDFAGFRPGIIVRAEDSHETYVAIRITASVHKDLTATIPNRAHGCDPGALFPEYAPPGTRTAPSRTGMVQHHGSEGNGTATRRTALTSGTSAAEHGAHSRRSVCD